MISFNYPHMCRDGHIQIGYSGWNSCPICFPTPKEEPECGECGQGSGAKGWVYNSGGFNQGPCPKCAPTPTEED